ARPDAPIPDAPTPTRHPRRLTKTARVSCGRLPIQVAHQDGQGKNVPEGPIRVVRVAGGADIRLSPRPMFGPRVAARVPNAPWASSRLDIYAAIKHPSMRLQFLAEGCSGLWSERNRHSGVEWGRLPPPRRPFAA